MKPFKKAAIIGVGLIGGSLGLNLKKKRLATEVVGVCRHQASATRAVELGAIDRGSTSLQLIKDAELLVFSAPVSAIISQAPAAARLVGQECIVTDAGSTKQSIVACLEELFPNYLGSHPLAGSEKKGVMFADAALFEGSTCIVTPTRRTRPQARARVEQLWRAAGCKTAAMTPQRHDEALAAISHLPHAIAFALINCIPSAVLPLGASGLKDTTRIAASDEQLWTDILLSNKERVLKAAARFEAEFQHFMRMIKTNDSAGLKRTIARARARRANLR